MLSILFCVCRNESLQKLGGRELASAIKCKVFLCIYFFSLEKNYIWNIISNLWYMIAKSYWTKIFLGHSTRAETWGWILLGKTGVLKILRISRNCPLLRSRAADWPAVQFQLIHKCCIAWSAEVPTKLDPTAPTRYLSSDRTCMNRL